jgi:hypothetical protein
MHLFVSNAIFSYVLYRFVSSLPLAVPAASSSPRSITLNFKTYNFKLNLKYHALGDYVLMTRRYGTIVTLTQGLTPNVGPPVRSHSRRGSALNQPSATASLATCNNTVSLILIRRCLIVLIKALFHSLRIPVPTFAQDH